MSELKPIKRYSWRGFAAGMALLVLTAASGVARYGWYSLTSIIGASFAGAICAHTIWIRNWNGLIWPNDREESLRWYHDNVLKGKKP